MSADQSSNHPPPRVATTHAADDAPVPSLAVSVAAKSVSTESNRGAEPSLAPASNINILARTVLPDLPASPSSPDSFIVNDEPDPEELEKEHHRGLLLKYYEDIAPNEIRETIIHETAEVRNRTYYINRKHLRNVVNQSAEEKKAEGEEKKEESKEESGGNGGVEYEAAEHETGGVKVPFIDVKDVAQQVFLASSPQITATTILTKAELQYWIKYYHYRTRTGITKTTTADTVWSGTTNSMEMAVGGHLDDGSITRVREKATEFVLPPHLPLQIDFPENYGKIYHITLQSITIQQVQKHRIQNKSELCLGLGRNNLLRG